MSDQQPPQQQQFTFIDVSARRDANRKKVKSHVANDVNRKKRHAAIRRHQQDLLSDLDGLAESDQVQCAVEANALSVKISQNPKAPFFGKFAVQPIQSRPPVSRNSLDVVAREGPKSESPLPCSLDAWALFCAALRNGQQVIRDTDNLLHPAGTRESQSSKSSSPTSVTTTDTPPIVLYLKNRRSKSTLPSRLVLSPEFELDLNYVNTYLRSQHEVVWSRNIKSNAYCYDHDYETGVWRECMSLALDHIEPKQGQTLHSDEVVITVQQAFSILDISLGATSRLLRKRHPNFLFGLLEIMHEALLNIRDHRLSWMLQTFVVQMAIATLGAKHPVTSLLTHLCICKRTSTDADAGHNRRHINNLITATIDILSDLFGGNSFQASGLKLGSVPRLLKANQVDEASDMLSQVEKAWMPMFTADAMPMQVLALEKLRVQRAEARILAAHDVGLDSNAEIDAERRSEADMAFKHDHQVQVHVDNLTENLKTLTLLSSETVKREARILAHQHTPGVSADTSSPSFSASASASTSPASTSTLVILDKLGGFLVRNSYNALPLYVYTHFDEIFSSVEHHPYPHPHLKTEQQWQQHQQSKRQSPSSPPPPSPPKDLNFATRVGRVLVQAIQHSPNKRAA